MQRHLTEKQKLRGKEHIENAIDFLHSRYEQILLLQRYQKSIGCFSIFKHELADYYVELQETKDRVSSLQRKYL